MGVTIPKGLTNALDSLVNSGVKPGRDACVDAVENALSRRVPNTKVVAQGTRPAFGVVEWLVLAYHADASAVNGRGLVPGAVMW